MSEKPIETTNNFYCSDGSHVELERGINMHNTGKTEKELWAVVNSQGEVVWSRGGSSSKSKLMVYGNEKNAKAGLRNYWTRQVHDKNEVTIRKIYSC